MACGTPARTLTEQIVPLKSRAWRREDETLRRAPFGLLKIARHDDRPVIRLARSPVNSPYVLTRIPSRRPHGNMPAPGTAIGLAGGAMAEQMKADRRARLE
jgi:hypothetical protein